MSRSVSGKDAARGGRPPQGRRGRGESGSERGGTTGQSAKQRSARQGTGAQARREAQRQAHEERTEQAGRGGRRAGRPGSSGRRRAQPGQKRTRLYIWGSIALVVVIVGIFVAVNAMSGNTSNTVYEAKPVPAAITHQVTHVPASVFDKVGTGISGTIFPPKVETGQPLLTYTKKPGVFGMFGEFCPYCAAERWSIITAFSRFGTFTGLKTMQSSPTDVYPKTQTFTFRTATYSSPYFHAKLVEYYGQDNASGQHFPITKLTKQDKALLTKYDYTTTYSSSGNIPFVDFGNQLVSEGVGYNPQPLQGLSRATIAAALSSSKNAVTKLIIADANYMSASICHIDGGKPGSVCSSAGVKAAAKALHIST